MNIHLESYHLSNQALDMFQKGYFNMTSLLRTSDKIHLLLPVLIQSEETTIIDPLLLAVPQSIILLQNKNKLIKKSYMNADEEDLLMDHNFPTITEMNHNKKLKLLGQKLILKMISLNSITKYNLKQWLYDPQALLYLSSLMDLHTLESLCKFITMKNKGLDEKLPGNLRMGLDMLKMTLNSLDSTSSIDVDVDVEGSEL